MTCGTEDIGCGLGASAERCLDCRPKAVSEATSTPVSNLHMTLLSVRPREELKCSSPVRVTIGLTHREDYADRIYNAMAEAANASRYAPLC